MTKIVLMVVIAYSNQPSTTYRMVAKNADDCFSQAIMLQAKGPPDDENVVKYMIGCSFEEAAPREHL